MQKGKIETAERIALNQLDRWNDAAFRMKRLTQLRYLGSLKSGKLKIPRERMERELAMCEDELDIEVIIKREKTAKTRAQINAFHGPIIEQIQADEMAREGLYRSEDRVKQELKEMFLKKEPQYYNDGSPVIIKIQHPERKGVTYDWHFEKLPSLADLSIEQMRAFISAILDHFLHERGLDIQIDKELAKIK